jgi:undecaprenyl-diphosphatase
MSKTSRTDLVRVPSAPITRADVDERPPGERYFRHPGDVLRLVLWGATAVTLALILSVATASSEGLTTDLGRAAGRLPMSLRQLVLALAQVCAVAVPAVLLVVLLWQQRWRRLGILLLAGAAGGAVFALVDAALSLHPHVANAVNDDTWIASTRFPSLGYVAGVAAATVVGKPWVPRAWKRAGDLAVLALIGAMAIAGSAGVLELLLAAAVGATVGAALLVAFGSPNRRPLPATIAAALEDAGLGPVELSIERAEGGRAQLYRGQANGRRLFVKVYAQDSRDADLLYRGYRALLFRGPSDDWPALSLQHDVEHEALLLLLGRKAGVTCPTLEALTALPDGSVTLALDQVDGRRLDSLDAEEIDGELLDAIWREVARMHAAKLAHRALHPSNIIVDGQRPVIIDLASAQESATARMQAIDRAELLASLTALVGLEPAIASAARVLDAADLAAAMPFLQPLALSAVTRKQTSKAGLRELRSGVADATGVEAIPLERLVRVRPRTLMMIAVLVGAFYLLLPQLANVDDSVRALRSANYWWLAVCIVMSLATYVASAIGLAGGVPGHIPFVPTIEAQAASSFVNRVTPANVGGMALNVRFLQKAGVEPGAAVTAMGLNVLAGGVVHFVLLIVFVAWAGQQNAGFKIPASSKMLVIIAAVLAIIGIVMATRRGRRLFRTHVWRYVKQSLSSIAVLSRSPMKLTMLFGGSAGITLAYIAALAASVAAFGGDVNFAQVGAVYLGASVVAAAAPTPGGLGAMEAALVAGLTGVGMNSADAVAAVLSYRLATYWLPILPGWISFHVLERRNFI